MAGLGVAIMVACVPCCCVLSVVVVVAVVLFFCLLARVGVLVHRRGMVLGHACRMPSTGANIGVLSLKTELAAGLTYT